MPGLTSEVEIIIYGNSNASAIASPLTTGPRSVPQQKFTPQGASGRQKMLFPEDFARRAGCSELVFERLSIQEFVVGTIRIILQGGISEEEKVARLSHLLELMILATNYNWTGIPIKDYLGQPHNLTFPSVDDLVRLIVEIGPRLINNCMLTQKIIIYWDFPSKASYLQNYPFHSEQDVLHCVVKGWPMRFHIFISNWDMVS